MRVDGIENEKRIGVIKNNTREQKRKERKRDQTRKTNKPSDLNVKFSLFWLLYSFVIVE